MPVSILIDVDFPAPFGPMYASRSPASTANVIDWTASTSPNRFASACASITTMRHPTVMLNVHRFGPDEGPAILCLHGVTGHGLRFRRLATDCLGGRRVLAVDLRGHGRSPWTPPWTAEQHVLDLIDLLEAEELETVDIVGHSFGGLIATHVASAIGEHVGRVVLIDPAIELEPEHRVRRGGGGPQPAVPGARSRRRRRRVASRARPPGTPAPTRTCDDHLERGDDGRYRFRFCPSAAVTAWSEMAGPVVDLPRVRRAGCT